MNSALEDAFNIGMSKLNSLGICPILFYGTLLGYRRNNNFIPGDEDIDFLVSKGDLEILKQHIFNHIILGMFPEYTAENVPYIMGKFSINPTEHVDFYQYEVVDEKLQIKWDKLEYNLSDIFPLKSTSFKGWDVLVPNNVERVLSYTYGDSWETPLSRSDGYTFEKYTKMDLNEYTKKWGPIKLLASTNKHELPIVLKNGLLRLIF